MAIPQSLSNILNLPSMHPRSLAMPFPFMTDIARLTCQQIYYKPNAIILVPILMNGLTNLEGNFFIRTGRAQGERSVQPLTMLKVESLLLHLSTIFANS